LGIQPTRTPNRYVTFGGGRGWKRTFGGLNAYLRLSRIIPVAILLVEMSKLIMFNTYIMN
jgi:hypothetical protein